MDAETNKQFWRLPSTIRRQYRTEQVRRVDIVGEGTKAVVLILLTDGSTDTWRFSKRISLEHLGWQKDQVHPLVNPMTQEQANKQAVQIVERYYDGLYTKMDVQIQFIALADKLCDDTTEAVQSGEPVPTSWLTKMREGD